MRPSAPAWSGAATTGRWTSSRAGRWRASCWPSWPASRVGGEAQVDAAVRGIQPPLGDRLAAGEEVDAVGAVGVRVAEEGRLPAAEGVVGDRDRDRHVDADHADLDLALEPPGGAAVVGEQGGAVAVGV